MATEAREMSPVQFYKDQPWALKGEPTKKNFEAKIEKVNAEEAEVADQEPVVASGDAEVEVVDAPVLNDESDDDDVISLSE